MGFVDDVKENVGDKVDNAENKLHEMKGHAEGYSDAQNDKCDCGKDGCDCPKGECNC